MEQKLSKSNVEPIFAVDPKFDRVFLELFSPIRNDSKQNLINFINAIFEEKGLNPVIDLSPFSENLPAFQYTTESRIGRIDIIAKDSTNRLINIEIQRATQEFFLKGPLSMHADCMEDR